LPNHRGAYWTGPVTSRFGTAGGGGGAVCLRERNGRGTNHIISEKKVTTKAPGRKKFLRTLFVDVASQQETKGRLDLCNQEAGGFMV